MTTGSGRELPNLIEAYIDYLSVCEVPLVFKRWAAVALVAGALERRVWCWGRGFRIHPNLFVLLIAPPGIGKNVVIDPVNELWSATGVLNVLSNRATLAAMLESMASYQQMIEVDGEKVLSNSCVLALGEFGHLFKEQDTEMMNAINAFYDAKDTPFVDSTISRGKVTIDRPCLTLLTGTQPQFLDRVLPEAAFQMGFATRLVMCYADETLKGTVFGRTRRPQHQLALAMTRDLLQLKLLSGEYHFDQEASEFFEAWYQAGCKPVPSHMRLQDYNTRRWASAFKLSMVLTAAKSQELIIHLPEVQTAIDLLLGAETTLPQAFSAMVGSSDAALISETRQFVFKNYIQKKAPTRESMVVAFLSQRVPAHRIRPLLDTLISAHALKEEGYNAPGLRMFLPGDNSES